MNVAKQAWTPASALAQVLHPHTATVSLEVARLALRGVKEQQDQESVRAERHHYVLCLVLMEMTRLRPTSPKENVQVARDNADLAYPPPQSCALVDCARSEPHDHPVSGPYCEPPTTLTDPISRDAAAWVLNPAREPQP